MGHLFWTHYRRVRRAHRFPKYSDHELQPFFAEIEKGYCWRQAAERCLYPYEFMLSTLISNKTALERMIELEHAAREAIRSGAMVAPADKWESR